MWEEFFTQLWNAAQAAGPFGTVIAVFMWWQTNNERKILLKERDGLLERTINSMHSATEAIRDNTRAILLISNRKD